MTRPIVVGVDGTGSGQDAVALATRLARATGDPLIVACVYPEGRRASLDAAEVRGPAAKALEAASELAEEAGAEYRTVPSSSPARGLAELAEEETVPIEVRKEYQEALDRALAGLPEEVRATGELLYGEVVDELSVVGERGVDLLVCGSRGYGPVRRVLLGTVSAAVVRQASVPVLVVPRGGG